MRKFSKVLIVFLLLFSGYIFIRLQSLQKKLSLVERHLGGIGTISCDKQEVLDRVKESIVRVVGGGGEGSGVMINDYGFIVTNFHVIQFEPSPKIIFSDYSFESAQIILADKEKDIAILEVKKFTEDELMSVVMKDFVLKTDQKNNVNPLDKVYAFGFPWGTDLAGGVTVQEGNFVSNRTVDDIQYLQTDISLVSGQSGGALTDSCGNLLGINTSGVAGLGMAISTETIENILSTMDEVSDPLEDVAKIEFIPHESPLEAVKAFYNYQKVRKLQKAYNLLSKEFLNNDTFEEWKKNYSQVIDTAMFSVKEVEGKENTIYVKLGSQDLVGEEVVYKYFEGTWEVIQERESWRLWKPDIQQIEEPKWDWFYDWDEVDEE